MRAEYPKVPSRVRLLFSHPGDLLLKHALRFGYAGIAVQIVELIRVFLKIVECAITGIGRVDQLVPLATRDLDIAPPRAVSGKIAETIFGRRLLRLRRRTSKDLFSSISPARARSCRGKVLWSRRRASNTRLRAALSFLS